MWNIVLVILVDTFGRVPESLEKRLRQLETIGRIDYSVVKIRILNRVLES